MLPTQIRYIFNLNLAHIEYITSEKSLKTNHKRKLDKLSSFWFRVAKNDDRNLSKQ